MSVAMHFVAAMAVVYLAQADTAPPRPLFRAPKASLVYLPVVPVEIPLVRMAELAPPAPLPVKTEEPAPPRPIDRPAPVFESRRAEVRPHAPELPIEPAPTPPPPTRPSARPKPEVTVGSFATVAAPAKTPEQVRQIEIAGFDRAASKPVELKPATTSLGAFDRAVPAHNTAQPPAEIVVADAGFNRANVVASTTSEGRVVRDTGFGNSNSRETPRAAETPAQVTTVAFDAVRAPQTAAKNEEPARPRIIPVEVLSKPTPIYTEEARKLRIQGDVLLEVEFASTGSIRVLRIVRGLGHGLDEAAVDAAKQIRFKPAQDSGRSVDSRATVNIVFRLA